MSDEGTPLPIHHHEVKPAGLDRPLFYKVSEVADMLGTSSVTLYRAIAEGQFPAIRIRTRLVVPAKAIDLLINAAIDQQTVIDVANWAAKAA